MNKRINDWINWVLYDELIAGKLNAPKHLLGIHEYGEGQIITAYRPHAVEVKVTSRTGKKVHTMEKVTDEGFYAIFFPKKEFSGTKYNLVTTYEDGTTFPTADPYAFDSQISDFDSYLFAEGKHYEIYNKFGAHPMTIDGVKGTYFAVWAPDARRVSVVGDFNMWDGNLHPMQLRPNGGIYELFIPNVLSGAVYKYQILTRYDEILYKSDPYGNQAQMRPDNGSVVADLTSYKWKDTAWVNKRRTYSRTDRMKMPMTIYEMHLGSWRKKVEDDDSGFFSYRELAPMVADYVKDMGYTHVEIMGIAEYPFDGSWGYQVTNYYAPTSRYGSPEDFMYFIDYLHSKGIGIILDWVPAHFPKDAHGLGRFDGMPLYEHPDPRRGEHPDWGTYIFDYGRAEVANFLIANALFWVEKFHIDALRVDAVASMLYLDYGKQDGQWLPNENGGNENLDAIKLLQNINAIMEEKNPGAFLIAEESTAWAGVTAPASMNGLGFLFKWNMGWMHDFLEYMKLDPYFRSNNHNKMTFAMTYAYSENFILVLSHDEVVHLKCSMINKMPGEYEDKFANLKVGYTFMMGHPGKKLLFMGQDFGQWAEWSEAKSLDWHLTNENMHRDLQKYVKSLLSIYNRYKACYELDQDPEGFEWMDPDDNTRSIYSFVRKTMDGRDSILYVCNFTPVARPDFRVGVPCPGRYTLLLNEKCEEGTEYIAEKIPTDRMEYSIPLPLAPYGTAIIKFNYKKVKKPIKKTKK